MGWVVENKFFLLGDGVRICLQRPTLFQREASALLMLIIVCQEALVRF